MQDSHPRLTRVEVALVLAVAVCLFLFLNGPIWTHPWDPDPSILWSYVPIPLLVFLLLLRGRRLRVSSLLLDTLKVVLLKFGITASLLLVIWSTSGVTPRRPVVAARRAEPLPSPVPTSAPTVFAERDLVMLRVKVANEDGSPAAGALVWVARGLERFTFAVPGEPVAMEAGAAALSGSGFQPPLIALQTGQPLAARSVDGRLHTLHVTSDTGESLLNAPLLAAGMVRAITFARPGGLSTLRCEVHPEERGTLLLLAHPFRATTDSRGEAVLRGVPRAALEVAARSDRAVGRTTLDVGPGDAAGVAIRLARKDASASTSPH